MVSAPIYCQDIYFVTVNTTRESSGTAACAKNSSIDSISSIDTCGRVLNSARLCHRGGCYYHVLDSEHTSRCQNNGDYLKHNVNRIQEFIT